MSTLSIAHIGSSSLWWYDDSTCLLVIEIMIYDVYIKIDSQLPNLEVFLRSLMNASLNILILNYLVMLFTRAGLQKQCEELFCMFSHEYLKKIMMKCLVCYQLKISKIMLKCSKTVSRNFGLGKGEAATSLVMPKSEIRCQGPQIMIMLWPSRYVGSQGLIL